MYKEQDNVSPFRGAIVLILLICSEWKTAHCSNFTTCSPTEKDCLSESIKKGLGARSLG